MCFSQDLSTVFLSFRVGVDPDQDLQPCGDSFQVLQGVSAIQNVKMSSVENSDELLACEGVSI